MSRPHLIAVYLAGVILIDDVECAVNILNFFISRIVRASLLTPAVAAGFLGGQHRARPRNAALITSLPRPLRPACEQSITDPQGCTSPP